MFFGIKSIASNVLADSYTNKSLLSSKIPTTIQTQQIIYIEDYYGDTFTEEQKNKFNMYFNITELEEHKFKYRMGNSYGPNWMFYHKPNLTVNYNAIAINNSKFWKFYFELVKQHPVTAFEGFQRATGIVWASQGYGPTAYRGYSRSEFDKYVYPAYMQAMRPIISWLDTNIFKLFSGIGIIFIRPAFYMILILLFCIVGFNRHKYKMVLMICPALLNAIGYFIVIASQDVRYFFINYIIAIITLVYAMMSNNSKEKEITVENVNE